MPYCLKSMIWKTSQAHPPKSHECYREDSLISLGYSLFHQNCHGQTRDPPAAEGRHTEHSFGRRKPEARRPIKNEKLWPRM